MFIVQKHYPQWPHTEFEFNLKLYKKLTGAAFALWSLNKVSLKGWDLNGLFDDLEKKERRLQGIMNVRLKFKTRLKYGWLHLKLYSMFQDLSRCSIETGFWQIWDAA